ncbi:hypothetical protein CYMTET_30248, partial [Cymbomonas tetramitiformis]
MDNKKTLTLLGGDPCSIFNKKLELAIQETCKAQKFELVKSEQPPFIAEWKFWNNFSPDWVDWNATNQAMQEWEDSGEDPNIPNHLTVGSFHCTDSDDLLQRASSVVFVVSTEVRCFEECVARRINPDVYERCVWPAHSARATRFLQRIQTEPDLAARTLVIDAQLLVRSREQLEDAVAATVNFVQRDSAAGQVVAPSWAHLALDVREALQRVSCAATAPKRTAMQLNHIRLNLRNAIKQQARDFAHRVVALLQHSDSAVIAEGVKLLWHKLVREYAGFMVKEECAVYINMCISNSIQGTRIVVLMVNVMAHALDASRRAEEALVGATGLEPPPDALQEFQQGAIGRGRDGQLISAPSHRVLLEMCDVLSAMCAHYHLRHETFQLCPEVFRITLRLLQSRFGNVQLAGLRLVYYALNADSRRYSASLADAAAAEGADMRPAAEMLLRATTRLHLDPILSAAAALTRPSTPPSTDSRPSGEPLKQYLQCLYQYTGLLGVCRMLLHNAPRHCAAVTPELAVSLADAARAALSPELDLGTEGRWSAAHCYGVLGALLECGPPAVVGVLLEHAPAMMEGASKVLRCCLADDAAGCRSFGLAADFLATVCRVVRSAKPEGTAEVPREDVEGQAARGAAPPSTGADGMPGLVESSRGTVLEPGAKPPAGDGGLGERARAPLSQLAHELDGALSGECGAAGSQQAAMETGMEAKVEKAAPAMMHLHAYERACERLEKAVMRREAEQMRAQQQQLEEELRAMRQDLERAEAEKLAAQAEALAAGRASQALEQRCAELLARAPAAPAAEVAVETLHAEGAPTATDAGGDDAHPLLGVEAGAVTQAEAEGFIRWLHARREGLRDMRRSICGSLRHLGAELYSSPTHFLMELLQNAEDNTYSPEAGPPTLRVRVGEDYLHLWNNERGFRPCDVLSVCSLAASTKTGGKYIGQKGLGFKSVFAATCSPHVVSGPWAFRFCLPGKDEMAAITPHWLRPEQLPAPLRAQAPDAVTTAVISGADSVSNPAVPGTHLFLPLKDGLETNFCDSLVAALDPLIMLAMRRLQRLVIVDSRTSKQSLISRSSTPLPLQGWVQQSEASGAVASPAPASVSFGDFAFENLTMEELRLEVKSSGGSGEDVSALSRSTSAYSDASASSEVGSASGEALSRAGSATSAASETNGQGAQYTIQCGEAEQPPIPDGCRFRAFSAELAIPASLAEATAQHRAGVTRTRITLCFPDAEDVDLARFTCSVFAGLPVCNVGLRVLVNADWLLVTSREAVREGSTWNAFLRDAAAALIAWACLHDPPLREHLGAYLPDAADVRMTPWWRALASAVARHLTAHLTLLLTGPASNAADATSSSNPARVVLPNAEVQALVPAPLLQRHAGIRVLDPAVLRLSEAVLAQLQVRTLDVSDVLCCWAATATAGQLNNDIPKLDVDGASGIAAATEFATWADAQPDTWWGRLFSLLLAAAAGNPSILELARTRPLFLLRQGCNTAASAPSASRGGPTSGRQRGPLPPQKCACFMGAGGAEGGVLEAPPPEAWRAGMCLVDAASAAERSVLRRLGLMEPTAVRLLDMVVRIHLERPEAPGSMQEVWGDLAFVRAHVAEFRLVVSHFLGPPAPPGAPPAAGGLLSVPVMTKGAQRFSLGVDAALPTALGVALMPEQREGGRPIVALPYGRDPRLHHTAMGMGADLFEEQMEWEVFLMQELGCTPPEPSADSAGLTMPLALPLFTMLTLRAAELSERSLTRLEAEAPCTLGALQHIPVVTEDGRMTPIGATADATVSGGLLPAVQVPRHARRVAELLGVTLEATFDTCLKALATLAACGERSTNVYAEWLLKLRSAAEAPGRSEEARDVPPFALPAELAAVPMLYLPDGLGDGGAARGSWLALRDIYVAGDDTAAHDSDEAVAVAAAYLSRGMVSPSRNAIYWIFAPTLRRLGDACELLNDSLLHTAPSAPPGASPHSAASLRWRLEELGNADLRPAGGWPSIGEVLRTARVWRQGAESGWGPTMHEENPRRAQTGHEAEEEEEEARLPLALHNGSMELRTGAAVRASLSPCFVDAAVQAAQDGGTAGTAQSSWMDPEVVRRCPLLVAAAGLEYLEAGSRLVWAHDVNNPELVLQDVTTQFRQRLGDEEVDVVLTGHLSLGVVAADSHEFRVLRDVPFMIAGRTVAVCARYVEDASKAPLFAAALARLLEVRKGCGPAEAASEARAALVRCTGIPTNRSINANAHTFWESACGPPSVHDLLEVILPPSDVAAALRSVDLTGDFSSRAMSDGGEGVASEDNSEGLTVASAYLSIAPRSLPMHELYCARTRGLLEDESAPGGTSTGGTTSTSGAHLPGGRRAVVVDAEELKRTGDAAEHFVYCMLRRMYGEAVSPQNWRSSARLAVFPEARSGVDDSAGYDFEVEDTRGVLLQGGGALRKCYLEVKGAARALD